MIQYAFEVTLICIAVHALFWEGMLLFRLGRVIATLIWLPSFAVCYILCRWFMGIGDVAELSHKVESWITKPLFTCLICMSSFWTIIWFLAMGHVLNQATIYLMFMVCGLNVIADSIIYALRGGDN